MVICWVRSPMVGDDHPSIAQRHRCRVQWDRIIQCTQKVRWQKFVTQVSWGYLGKGWRGTRATPCFQNAHAVTENLNKLHCNGKNRLCYILLAFFMAITIDISTFRFKRVNSSNTATDSDAGQQQLCRHFASAIEQRFLQGLQWL